MTNDRFLFVLRLVRTVLRLSREWLSRDQAGGALSSAAVPRVGLGPTTPPLCRCAKRATDLTLPTLRVFDRSTPTLFAASALGVQNPSVARIPNRAITTHNHQRLDSRLRGNDG